jgi:threonylcarbamoyladenosine tRNA methylthiotransferase MtaB
LAKNDKKISKTRQKIEKIPKDYEDDLFAKQGRIRAYIKIQDGCDNFCTYCIIPYLRGRSRSRAIISILNEAINLGDDIKEIVLTGINVTDYKIDGEKGLLTLLTELDKFGKRIRLSSLEDTLVSDEFIKNLSKLENFCPHFHLSLQSGSDSVLKRMNRHYLAQDFKKSVDLIRKYFPHAGITTDVIVGFPNESEKEFKETLNFVKKVKFSALHIFQYSSRKGTVASKLYKDLPKEVKQDRFVRLEKVNKVLKKKFIKSNKKVKVLVEEKIGDYYVGYSENYIRCYIPSEEAIINQICSVKIQKPYLDGAIAKKI